MPSAYSKLFGKIMTQIRYDMSQFYSLKAVYEEILGKRSYRKLKETATLRDWKVETGKLLKAIELSIEEATVKIADADFHSEAKELLRLGSSLINSARDISGLFASLAATLIRLSFLQVGFIPRNFPESVRLTPKDWVLSFVRSVQYVQTLEQKELAARIKARTND
jgi:hypothetical protein